MPASIHLNEGGAFAMTMFAMLVMPVGDEADLGMFGLAAEDFAAFHFQPQPGALCAPGGHGFTVERLLLGGQGRAHQIVHQAQNIGAVTRAHQQLRAGRGCACVVVAATLAERIAAATGAVGIEWVHLITTSICRSFVDWPRTLHSTSRELACNRADH